MFKKLVEDSRTELVSRSKRAEREKDGKTRFQKRLKSHIASSTRQYNKIDMNQLFKEDIINIGIEIKGETNNYVVGISFSGFLEELQRELKKNNDILDLRIIIRALITCFNRNDVYIRCSCQDFCLEENTNIKLLNGENLPIKEIYNKFNNGEELWVYSTDEKGDFKPGKVKDVWISGHTNKLVKITLDNNKEIITTLSHKYMLRNGEYKEAKDLSVNESLMPIYFSYTNNGYENYKKNSDKGVTRFFSVYKEVANECLQQEIQDAKKRTNENIIQIHHKDFNKLNNYPSNLYPMGQLEHWKYHYEHLQESGNLEKFLEAGKEYWKTQEAKDKQAQVMSKVMKEYYSKFTHEERVENLKKNGLFTDEWKEKVSKGQKNVWANYSEEEYKNRCLINSKTNNDPIVKTKQIESQKQSYIENPKRIEVSKQNLLKAVESIKGKPLTDEHKKKISESHLSQTPEQKAEHTRKIRLSKLKKVLDYMVENKIQLTEDNYYKAINELKTNNKHRNFPHFSKCFTSFNDMISYFQLNHKVKSIEFLELNEEVPVYDLSVEKYNNFLVSAGVVLHNCYRFGYWATKNNILTGEKQNIPSDKTNPNDKLGAGCKHTLLVLNNTSWIIKVASVIRNYINYIEKHMQKQYANIIYPAIYGRKYTEPVQLDVFDDDKVETDSDTIDRSNRYAKNQFKQGNEYRIQSQKRPSEDQIEIETEEDIGEE